MTPDNQEHALAAILAAKIQTSSLNRAAQAKEPFDGPILMLPVAQAMFDVLACVCIASGHDEFEWWEFLREALDEAIERAQMKAFP